MNVHSDRKSALLDAAVRLAARQGADGFSMKSLATEAGVAVGSAYSYFPSREALLLEAYLRCLSDVAEVMCGALDGEPGFENQYKRVWFALWNYCLANPEAVLCRSQFDRLPAAYGLSAQQHKEQVFQPIASWLDQAMAEHHIVNLPHPAISALCFEPCLSLACNHNAGLMNADDSLIHQACSSTLRAITPGKP